MKKWILTLILASSSMAQAGAYLKCSFTEPFVTTVYNFSTSQLAIASAGESEKTLIDGVDFKIKDNGSYELSKNGKVLQNLVKTGNASDGMSDEVYEVEVKDSSQEMFANGGIGGCRMHIIR